MGPKPPPDPLTELLGEEPRTGSSRPWPRPWGLALRTVVLMAVGFLLAVSYREAVAAEPERTRAHAGLVDEVQTAQTRTDDLQARAEHLRRQLNEVQAATLGTGAADQLRQQEAVVGLVPVTGAGAVVTLADEPAPIDPTTGRSSGEEVNRVLDLDLQTVVNGLWAAGAEAVAINGQRLTATAAIRNAGGAILVDLRPVTSPYEVSAIGPAELERDFIGSAADAAMRDVAARFGLGYGTRSARDLRLPAAPGPVLRFASRA